MTDQPNSPDQGNGGNIHSSSVSSTGRPDGYSPLLSRLLEETMRDAEREKQNLDESIREKEAAARKVREEEELRKREEIQRRVEEEQARRRALIEAAQGKQAEPVAQDSGEVAAVPQTGETAVAAAAGKGSVIPWILVFLSLGGAGAVFYKFSTEADLLRAEKAAAEGKVSAITAKVEGAIPNREATDMAGKTVLPALGVLETAVDSLIGDVQANREDAATKGGKIAESEKKIAELKAALDEKTQALDSALAEKVELETQLADGNKARAAAASVKKKATPSEPKKKKVQINTNIFDPTAR